MTRLSLALFLLALFFCGIALVTLNKVETIVTILTVIVAGMCVLGGWAGMQSDVTPDKIESPRVIAPNSSLPKPELRQRTSDITPSPRRIPDVGEVRKQRAQRQRLNEIKRNAQRKGRA